MKQFQAGEGVYWVDATWGSPDTLRVTINSGVIESGLTHMVHGALYIDVRYPSEPSLIKQPNGAVVRVPHRVVFTTYRPAADEALRQIETMRAAYDKRLNELVSRFKEQ